MIIQKGQNQRLNAFTEGGKRYGQIVAIILEGSRRSRKETDFHNSVFWATEKKIALNTRLVRAENLFCNSHGNLVKNSNPYNL